eukprot:2544970-Rhodomonas_salina.2
MHTLATRKLKLSLINAHRSARDPSSTRTHAMVSAAVTHNTILGREGERENEDRGQRTEDRGQRTEWRWLQRSRVASGRDGSEEGGAAGPRGQVPRAPHLLQPRHRARFAARSRT